MWGYIRIYDHHPFFLLDHGSNEGVYQAKLKRLTARSLYMVGDYGKHHDISKRFSLVAYYESTKTNELEYN